MFVYILKRLLLIIPTTLGILVITFAINQFVPGGPVEQIVQELRTRGSGGEGGGGGGFTSYRAAQGV
ncbi:MAG TPA: microcin ABC transporter permease, partial [Burkholderiales bacterium]|nr:microcin ABC transporter permease [Burkholderiales bacterium]